MTLAIISALLFLNTNVLASEINSFERIDGKDRFQVAVNLSQKGWGDGADTAVVGFYNAYADALAAGPLAYHLDAPILLTHSNKLTDVTKNELIRLHAKNVILVGGSGSISDSVLNEIKNLGISVRRIGGHDRFEVSANIAKELPANSSAIIAYGLNFPDALAISPYAAINGMPILLTRTTNIPKETSDALKNRRIANTIVVGGEGSIGQAVFNQLPNPQRIGGKDRYEVAANVVKQLGLESRKIYVATGATFADALTGSVLAAKEGASILLTRLNNVPEQTFQVLKEKNINSFTILGGTGSISEGTSRALYEQVNKSPVVYFVPHADDEVLTYSVNVRNEISKGREVFLVLLSKGNDSFSREIINGVQDLESINQEKVGSPVYCHWHQTYHDPIQEQFLDGYISVEKFGEIRINEFYRSGNALGIPNDHLFNEAIPVPEVTVARMKEIMLSYISKFPNAEFRTMSKHDYHVEHAAMGLALEELVQENKVNRYNTQYFVSIYNDRVAHQNLDEHVYVEKLYNESDSGFIKNSINTYKEYNPSKGLYASGYHSVARQFDMFEKNIYTKFHY
jgi:N-acetylmuramoyl-L-alanine amidase